MRNLKRVLSLALSAVMLLGLMVMGASAANVSDFTDADQITNQEAAAITTAIKLFSGYGDGTFRPGNIVTRAEMATIICKMLYGADVNASNMSGVNIFKDVTETWQVGYVNLCNSLKIVTGYGDGTFKPDQTVTTAEAALMICKALGYFQNNAEYGDNWELAAISKATQLGLMGNLRLSANAGLTRDNVSVMAFNALAWAVPVEYNSTFGTYYLRGGSLMSGVPIGNQIPGEHDDVTLGYQNFNLVGEYGTDEFGRPGMQWGFGEYRKATSGGNVQTILRDDIAFSANTPVVTYTSGQRNVNALRNYTINSAALTVDGESQSNLTSKDDIRPLTADGVIVEVYAGSDEAAANEITQVVVTKPQVAKVTGVNTRAKTVTLSLDKTPATYVVRENDPFYSVVSGVQNGDILLAVHSKAAGLMDLWIPESVTGVVTEVKTGSDQNTVGVVDGVRCTVSSRLAIGHGFDQNNQINNTATVYLDRNGYAMYVAPATVEAATNYIYVTNVWQVSEIVRGIPTPTNYARGVDTNGEIVTLKIANNIYKGGNRAVPVYDTLVYDANFPGVKYGINTGSGAAYMFDETATTGKTSDGEYKKYGTSESSGTVSYSFFLGTMDATTGANTGFFAEYQQGAVDAELYVLKVPAAGTINNKGVMAEATNGIQSYERTLGGVYMSSDVKFISANYNERKDTLSASTSTGVKFVPKDTKYVPVVSEDSAGRCLITAVYILNGTSYSTDLYYVSGNASYRVSYADASGEPAVGYNNGLYLSGESLSGAVTEVVGAGFYQLAGRDGEGYRLARYDGDNEIMNTIVTDAYNRSILVDNTWYDVSDAVWCDASGSRDYTVDSVDSVRALMDTGVKVYVSFTYGDSSEKAISCLYITKYEPMSGKVIGQPAADGSKTTKTVQNITISSAEDTVVALSGEIKKGIPDEANSVWTKSDMSGLDNYFVIAVALPGTNNSQYNAYRITSPANNPRNWTSGTYPWSADGTMDANGVKMSVTNKDRTDGSLGILVQEGTVVTIEVMLGVTETTKLTHDHNGAYKTGTNAADFNAEFDPTYTITIDTSGVVTVS